MVPSSVPVSAQGLVCFGLSSLALIPLRIALLRRSRNKAGQAYHLRFLPPRDGDSRMRSWVASITSGEVMERLNTFTGRMVLTKVGSRVVRAATNLSKDRRNEVGTVLRSSNTYLEG